MVVRITDMVLRIAGVLALILGILFWTEIAAGPLVPIHMLLGIIVTLSVWILGAVIVSTKGGAGLGITAFVLGLVLVIIGLTQRTILVGNLHWIIRVIHLLLGVLAIGIGEMIAARYKRVVVATQSAK